MSVRDVSEAHQERLIRSVEAATATGLSLWRRMDFADLDASWAEIEPALVAAVSRRQLTMARAADPYTGSVSREFGFSGGPSRVVPEAFVGVDGSGRSTAGLLHGAVTTTKEAVGAGLSRPQSFQAGASYLAAMLKTAIADAARSADMVSSAGRGYTVMVRVVEPGACSRCIVLAGATRFRPFKRHPACKCTCQPIPGDRYSAGDFGGPADAFERMSEAEQERAFGRAGAEAIREGASISQVVSARRGVSMRAASSTPSAAGWQRMQKTTIGFRPDGSPVQVYSTVEGTTVRGLFGAAQSSRTRLAGARYSSATRVRLMPETIMEIAGDDTALRQAFLRDAGYLQYQASLPINQPALDRALVDKATLRYGNFTLG